MDKQTLLVALLGIVLVVSLFQALQISNLQNKGKTSITGAATAAAANQGFSSQEEMMAAHHGGGAGASAPSGAGSGSSGLDSVPNMVGGC